MSSIYVYAFCLSFLAIQVLCTEVQCPWCCILVKPCLTKLTTKFSSHGPANPAAARASPTATMELACGGRKVEIRKLHDIRGYNANQQTSDRVGARCETQAACLHLI